MTVLLAMDANSQYWSRKEKVELGVCLCHWLAILSAMLQVVGEDAPTTLPKNSFYVEP